MPRQVYRCPVHEEQERNVPFGEEVPKFVYCQVRETLEDGAPRQCFRRCNWVPSAPNFIGGPTTGAQKE